MKIEYEITSYIGSLTTVCRSDTCYQPLRPPIRFKIFRRLCSFKLGAGLVHVKDEKIVGSANYLCKRRTIKKHMWNKGQYVCEKENKQTGI